jgi:hypothetical protein
LDGMLAIVDGENVFSLGLCAVNGPVRQIIVDEKNEIAYGIAGDASDLGMVFSFDEKNGLRWLGRVFFNKFKEPGIAASCELSAIAISKDGRKLAIGSKDRMGCVYIYTL